MSRYDVEQLCEDIKTVLLDNLATYSTAIATEKGDDLTLPTIRTDAYFLHGLDERCANFDPFIVIGENSNESSGAIEGGAEEVVTIGITLVISDNGRSAGRIGSILYRYRRILKNIFEEKYQMVNNGNKIIVNNLTPISFESNDSSAQYKAIGITITTAIA